MRTARVLVNDREVAAEVGTALAAEGWPVVAGDSGDDDLGAIGAPASDAAASDASRGKPGAGDSVPRVGDGHVLVCDHESASAESRSSARMVVIAPTAEEALRVALRVG